MGIFDKIKDAIDGADESNGAKKDQTIGDELKERLDEAKSEAHEAKAERATEHAEAKQAKPKPTPTPAPTGGGAKTYTVKSGDTLSAIGAKYDVSYQDIAKASGIDNPDLIFPGQELTIPGK